MKRQTQVQEALISVIMDHPESPGVMAIAITYDGVAIAVPINAFEVGEAAELVTYQITEQVQFSTIRKPSKPVRSVRRKRSS